MEQICQSGTQLTAWQDGRVAVLRGSQCWQQAEGAPLLQTELHGAYTALHASLSMQPYKTGLGEGFVWRWQSTESSSPLLETRVWIEQATGDVLWEAFPLQEIKMEALCWPQPFVFNEMGMQNYTVLPMMQGCLIPNGWPQEVQNIEPPYFFERHGYMPWLGQVRGSGGWMGIVQTPWDAGYTVQHPAGGPTTVQIVWRESCGALAYPRSLRISLQDGGYVAFCKQYRRYLQERGQLLRLYNKIVRTPAVGRLLGTPVIHTEIKYEVKPEAACFDKVNPGQNNRLVTFAERAEQLRALAQRGVSSAYVHLDGWGVAGYDREHPDVLPPCAQAGGMDGLRTLADTCRAQGFLFALHDQYRDYYTDAASFDEANAVLDRFGNYPHDCTWNGGEQRFLCASLALDYVRRNYRALEKAGVRPDGVYLDVFSVVELDECLTASHPMTRRQCSEYRNACFDFITAQCGIVSSEEPLAGTVNHLALCHHAPYPTAPHLNGGAERGLAVPLFNLVFHDCIFTPWDLHEGAQSVMPNGRSGFLYALLNGGLGYLPIEPTADELEKSAAVSALHKKVGLCEMVSHEFIDGDTQRQRTKFSNGVRVEVDFQQNTWCIKQETEER